MSLINRCIKCGCNAELSSHYKDWMNNHCCAKHVDNQEVFFCNSCGKMHTSNNGRLCSDDFFFCNDCICNEVKQSDLERIVPSVINLLRLVGFEDITIDNFTCEIGTEETFRKANVLDASGFHQTISYIRDEHGISEMKERIVIREHYTELQFRSILAHEILHSWQARNNLTEFYDYSKTEHNQKAMEGFAQMGSYLVLMDFLRDRPNNRMANSKLERLLKWQDKVYGTPFHHIFEQFQSYPGSIRQKWYYIIRCAREGKLNID